MAHPPLPPAPLMRRVARPAPGLDLAEYYVARGRAQRQLIEAALPDGWSWEGRRALDFGCGAGRTLRAFLPEAATAELWGGDVDADSIRWLRENLVPPLRVFEVGDRPELPVPDGHFDVIWGLSIFTHVHRDWASWLLELRRALVDDGYLILSVLGEARPDLWREVTRGEAWDEDRLGMSVFRQDATWDQGGPIVFHSEWWVRAHWGRAFEVERFDRRPAGYSQSRVVLRKRPGAFAPEDLERPEPDEPREAAAAVWERDRLWRELERVYRSRSWRVTRPLRALSGRLG